MSDSELRIEVLNGGAALRQRFEPLADIRVEVFREYPYLYAGSRVYETSYLEIYFASPRSFAALVWDGDRCVGATTALPLGDTEPDMQRPFEQDGLSIGDIDYFGESVLLTRYRGRGLGVRFFELREAHARQHGLSICAFCAVDRGEGHPLRPRNYVPNDAFWSRRGYERRPALQTHFDWTDIGDDAPTSKPMTFWIRRLPPT